MSRISLVASVRSRRGPPCASVWRKAVRIRSETWPQLLLLPPPLDSARLSSCACPAWLPLRFPRLFFFLGCAASPGAVPAVAAPPGSCCFRPSGCSHADAAATAAFWGPLLGFTCITSGRLFVRSMLKSRLGSLPWSTVRPLLPCCRVRNPSGPSRDCFGCGRSHPLGTSTTLWQLRPPAP